MGYRFPGCGRGFVLVGPVVVVGVDVVAGDEMVTGSVDDGDGCWALENTTFFRWPDFRRAGPLMIAA